MKKNIIGTFYCPSKFHSLFNEKGGNTKEISFFTILNGCVYEFEWSCSKVKSEKHSLVFRQHNDARKMGKRNNELILEPKMLFLNKGE